MNWNQSSTKKEHLKAFYGLIPKSPYTGFRVQQKGGNNSGCEGNPKFDSLRLLRSLSWKGQPSWLTRGVSVAKLVDWSCLSKTDNFRACRAKYYERCVYQWIEKGLQMWYYRDILVAVNATSVYNFLNCPFNLSNDFMYILRVLSFLFRFIHYVKNPNLTVYWIGASRDRVTQEGSRRIFFGAEMPV